MDIGNAKVGVLIGINVFREFFNELYQHEAFPNKITFNKGNLHITVVLDQPQLSIVGPANTLYPRLSITGDLELRTMNEPEGPPLSTSPLNINVKLAFQMRAKPAAAPVLTIAYDGIDGDPSAPVTAGDVDTLFQQPSVADVLNSVEINILGPLTKGLGDIFFGEVNATAPAPNEWSVAVRILSGMRTAELCLGVFVALPGDNPDPGPIDSPMQTLTGLCVVYSRDFLDFVLNEASQARIGESENGAKITRMSMHMLDEAIQVSGRLEKDNAKINLNGPVELGLIRGTTRFATGTRGVSVDVDLPWYAEMLPWLSKILFFIPVFNLANIWLTPLVWDLEDDVEAAPQMIRRGLAGALGSSLEELAEGLRVEQGIGSVTMGGTPSHSLVKNGHLMLFAQTFVSTLTSPIVKAGYSHLFRHFVQYTLKDGRKFRATELARLVKQGKIITPGFHDVKGRYMRADPDNEIGNNLLERFS